MDNEEIRKLLQELKESSDGSSSVRSRVVKIHLDTPEEAERRKRAKEREQEKEARRLAREQEKERAEEEARQEERRLEAEKAAKEAVEEAKREAKAGFAADLEEQILLSDAGISPDAEPGEAADDLLSDLNWEYEKPELKSGFARDEDFDLGGRKRSGSTGVRAEKEILPEDDFESDEEEFRSGDEEGQESITGLPGLFGALSDRVLSFASGVHRSVKEDLSKVREKRSGKDGEALEMSAEEESESGPDMEEDAGEIALTGPSDGMDQEEKTPEREYGPDEEWKRRMEEAPKPKSRFQRLRGERRSLKNLLPKGKKAGKKTSETVLPHEDEDAGFPEKNAGFSKQDSGSAEPDTGVRNIEVINLNENQNNKEAEVIPLVGSTGPLPDPAELKRESTSRRSFFDRLKNRPPKKNTSKPEDVPKPENTLKPEDALKPEDTRKREDAPEPEYIWRREDAPEPEDTRKREENDRPEENFRLEEYSRPEENAEPEWDGEPEEEEGEKQPGRAGIFLSSHRKLLAAAVIAVAAVIVAFVCIFLITGRNSKTRRASIEADDGLAVQILEQPDSFTGEGDVKIRVKAPETIQSVTVNGENVVIEQGRTAEFNYHATGGTLDIMAVSTDKVRSAEVVLAYVDSQPPTVTIRKNGEGKIELNAEDSESGLEAVYIGNTNGLSDVPQYEKYTEPLDEDPEKEISYYAQDLAGNRTTPVVVALTPAESIAFDRDRYGLFPGSTQRVNLITTPENAFVNNLTLEAENAKIVQMEGDMQIRGMAEGDTKITATADGIAGVQASVSVAGQRKARISAIGDCTLGTDINFSQNNSFDAYEALYGDSYFFEKVKGILSSDDSTFANFEGTLTTSDARLDKPFAFKGDPSFTQILVDGSVDVVTLANNHTKDYGEQSLIDTENALKSAGIEWCLDDHIAWRDLNGIRTAYIGIYALENGLESMPLLKSTIAQAKKEGADLIIVEFHWGVELVVEIDEFQKELAHAAIDEGANLVLGTHSHVIQGIEKYNGAYIVYGLANFCFGGNTDPTSYDTIIWQQTFTLTADGLESEDDIAIIPCHVSGDLGTNNYQPVPVSGDAANAIMQRIDELSAPFGQSYSMYMVDGTLWTQDSGN